MGFNAEVLVSCNQHKDGIVQVDTSFMEGYFSVSRESLRQWGTKGCPKMARGKWDFIAVLKWRGGLASTNGDEESKENVFMRKAKADAFLKEQQGQLAEIDLQLRKGEVIEVAEVQEAIGKVVMNAKTQFLGLPSKIAPKLLGLSALDDLNNVLLEYADDLSKAKTEKTASAIIVKALSDFPKVESLVEINDVVTQLVYEILEELSSLKVEEMEGDGG